MIVKQIDLPLVNLVTVNPVIVKQIDLPWVNPVMVNPVIVKQIDLPGVIWVTVNPVIVKQIDLPWVNPVTVSLVIVKQIDLLWVIWVTVNPVIEKQIDLFVSQSGNGQSGDCETNWFTASQSGDGQSDDCETNWFICESIRWRSIRWLWNKLIYHESIRSPRVNPAIVKQIYLPWVIPVTVNPVVQFHYSYWWLCGWKNVWILISSFDEASTQFSNTTSENVKNTYNSMYCNCNRYGYTKFSTHSGYSLIYDAYQFPS